MTSLYQTPTATPTPTSLQQLERDIAERRAVANSNPPPSSLTIDAARNTVTDLTARLSLASSAETQTVIKSDLSQAQRRLATLIDERDAYEREAARLKADATRLAELQHDDRRLKAADADKRLQQSHSRFAHAAKELCRAYRDAYRQAVMNRAVPGASSSLPCDFNIAALVPPGWQGITSEHIRDNSLFWLRDEENNSQERAA